MTNAHIGFMNGYLFKQGFIDLFTNNSSAPGFLDDVDGEPLPAAKGGTPRYKLRKPLRYRDSSGRVHTIPAGFVTDYYSIPLLADKLLPGISQKLNADPGPAVLHDWLYRTGRIDDKPIQKTDADALLFEAMQTRKVDPLYIKAARLGLKYGGSPVWYAYRQADKFR